MTKTRLDIFDAYILIIKEHFIIIQPSLVHPYVSPHQDTTHLSRNITQWLTKKLTTPCQLAPSL